MNQVLFALFRLSQLYLTLCKFVKKKITNNVLLFPLLLAKLFQDLYNYSVTNFGVAVAYVYYH